MKSAAAIAAQHVAGRDVMANGHEKSPKAGLIADFVILMLDEQ